MNEETYDVQGDPMPGSRPEEETGEDTHLTRDLVNELVRIRKKRKIGQEPIAKAIGITQGRVSQMENLKGGHMTLDAFLIYAQTIGAEIVVVPAKDRKKK